MIDVWRYRARVETGINAVEQYRYEITGLIIANDDIGFAARIAMRACHQYLDRRGEEYDFRLVEMQWLGRVDDTNDI